MSKTTSELAAKDALIQRLIDEKIAQAELIQKQRDIITQYLILDIEDFLAEAREKAEAVAAQEAFDAAANEPHRSTVNGSLSLSLFSPPSSSPFKKNEKIHTPAQPS